MAGNERPNEVTPDKQAEYGKLRDAYEKKMGDAKNFPDEFLAKYEKENPAQYGVLKAFLENSTIAKENPGLVAMLNSLEASQQKWGAEKTAEIIFKTTVQAERPSAEAMLGLLSVNEKTKDQATGLRASFEKAAQSNNLVELQTAYQAIIDATKSIQPTIVEQDFDGKAFKGELKDGLPYNGEYRWSDEDGQEHRASVEDGFILESDVGTYDETTGQLKAGTRISQLGEGDYKVEQGKFNTQLGQLETGSRKTRFMGNESLQTGSFAQINPDSNSVQLKEGIGLRNGKPEVVANGEVMARFNERGVKIDETQTGKPLSEPEAIAAGLIDVKNGEAVPSAGYQWLDANDENNYGVVPAPESNPEPQAETASATPATGSNTPSAQPEKTRTSVDATALEKSFVAKLKEKSADYVTQETKDGKTTVTLTDKVPDRGSRIHHIVGPKDSGAVIEVSAEDLPKTVLSAKGVDYTWNGETWTDPAGKRLLIGPSYNTSFEISKKEAEPAPATPATAPAEPAPAAEPVVTPTSSPEAKTDPYDAWDAKTLETIGDKFTGDAKLKFQTGESSYLLDGTFKDGLFVAGKMTAASRDFKVSQDYTLKAGDTFKPAHGLWTTKEILPHFVQVKTKKPLFGGIFGKKKE